MAPVKPPEELKQANHLIDDATRDSQWYKHQFRSLHVYHTDLSLSASYKGNSKWKSCIGKNIKNTIRVEKSRTKKARKHGNAKSSFNHRTSKHIHVAGTEHLDSNTNMPHSEHETLDSNHIMMASDHELLKTIHKTGYAEAVNDLYETDPIGIRIHDSPYIGSPIDLQFVKSASELPEGDLEACMEIVEHTSGADYRASSIGWKPAEKKQEMADKDMMYLLVRQQGSFGRILGFMSFMFTYDDPPYQDREVVYMYEIHLLDLLRGRGLGSKLVGFMEAASRHCGITKTMLTVFAANEGARRLYEKLGYVKDSCSPEDRKVRQRVIEADYIILSKELAQQTCT